MSAIQTVAFGEATTGIWGVAWLPDTGGSVRVALGRGDEQNVHEAELEPGGSDDAWNLGGEGIALVVAPSGPTARGGVAGELESADGPCTVHGALHIDGDAAEVACRGWRSRAGFDAELARFDSVRWVAGWFGSLEGFSLTALRPRRARGHDADLVAAALIEDPAPPRVDDPRLSTTYAESGLPSRVGLELWFEAKEEEAPDGAHQYPRRAAGHTAGESMEWEAAGFALQATPMHWRSHGREGPGVYMLARRR